MHWSGYFPGVLLAVVPLIAQGTGQDPVERDAPPASMELDVRSFGAVCDGRDDAAAIQAAIDALPAGSTLLVPCVAGIGPSGIELRDKANVTVQGMHGGGFKALAGNHRRVLFHIDSCNGCTIQDLVIDGGDRGVAAINIDHCHDAVIRNNTILNIGYPALAAVVGAGNRNNRYVENSIAHTGILYDQKGNIVNATRGLWVGNESSAYYEWYPYIAGNRFHDIGGTAIVAHAFSAVIEGNSGDMLYWSGVKFVAPSGSEGITRIERNTFEGAGGRYSGGGIQIGSEMTNHETVVIENNTLEGEIESGVYMARGPVTGRIVNNTFRNNVQAGITVLCSVNRLVVRGNRIESDRPGKQFQGIRLIADRGVSIRDVEITGNTIRGQHENGIQIMTNGGTIGGIVIHSNALADLGWYGILFDEKAAPNTIRNITLGPNCFLNNRRGTLGDYRAQRIRPPLPVCPK